MNIAELQKKLIAVARSTPPSDRVPLAFEKRIMARLTSEKLMDTWALWSRLLWRAAGPCVAIMLALGIWTAFFNDNAGLDNLAPDLEQAVMAPLAQLENNSW